jgi:Tfp pilus assembly protein PilO
MAFTKREHLIILITAIAVILLVADKYCLSPMLDHYSQRKQNMEKLRTELQQSMAAIDRKNILQKQWDRMKESGLTEDSEQMESSVLRYVKDSSLKNNIILSSVQPDRVSVSHDVEEMEFIVSGSGSMDSITKFLWDMETMNFPIKIKTFQLGSNDESARQMSLQVKLSSICISLQNKNKMGK